MAASAHLQSIAGSAASSSSIDEITASRVLMDHFGARAITLLTGDRQGECIGRVSANDCWVVLDEACLKMARVAVRRYRQSGTSRPFSAAVTELFPDPAAYLARAIKSVMSDAARRDRREPSASSLDQPLGDGTDSLSLADLIREERTWKLPEEATLSACERDEFRRALITALRTVKPSYLEALVRDMRREKIREAGGRVEPHTDGERQTLCRARATVAKILRTNCGDQNTLMRLLERRSSAPAPRRSVTPQWSEARTQALRSRLLQGWADRSRLLPDERVEEAVVHYIQHNASADAPSPETRRAVRVLDLYKMQFRTPQGSEAALLYRQALEARQNGRIEEALSLYRQCYAAEPGFVEALSEVGVLQSQLGNLRDALRVYLSIIEKFPGTDHSLRAATNAADIYITWFDAGRNRERNIELAIHYARMAMQRPTPMRACNLITALVKDRYYPEAQQVLMQVLRENTAACSAESVLNTLFQIRDADLVRWYGWLEQEMNGEVTA
jgi:tetratricopeptide (TPR) repeat protein